MNNYQSPITNHQSPITNHQSPITNHQSPITNHQSPITNHQSPITNHQSPITNHQSPITNHQLPITNHQLPITNHQSPITNHQSPITNHQSPITNHQSPITNHQSPITNHQSPITNHQSPITNHQSPITNHQSPITNHQSPITNHQSPITNHQSFPIFWILRISRLFQKGTFFMSNSIYTVYIYECLSSCLIILIKLQIYFFGMKFQSIIFCLLLLQNRTLVDGQGYFTCSAHSDCYPFMQPFCSGNSCIPPSSNSDCDYLGIGLGHMGTWVTTGYTLCTRSCSTNKDCSTLPTARICSFGYCAECLADSDCDALGFQAHNCLSATSTFSFCDYAGAITDCAAGLPGCASFTIACFPDANSNRCWLGCASTSDCSDGVCILNSNPDSPSGTCTDFTIWPPSISCSTNNDCPSLTSSQCWSGTYCSACSEDSGCTHLSGTEYCNSGTCQFCSLSNNAECSSVTASACSGGLFCTACSADLDCSHLSSTPYCNSGTCGACSVADNSGCPKTNSSKCSSSTTSTTFTCIACSVDADCAHLTKTPICNDLGICGTSDYSTAYNITLTPSQLATTLSLASGSSAQAAVTSASLAVSTLSGAGSRLFGATFGAQMLQMCVFINISYPSQVLVFFNTSSSVNIALPIFPDVLSSSYYTEDATLNQIEDNGTLQMFAVSPYVYDNVASTVITLIMTLLLVGFVYGLAHHKIRGKCSNPKIVRFYQRLDIACSNSFIAGVFSNTLQLGFYSFLNLKYPIIKTGFGIANLVSSIIFLVIVGAYFTWSIIRLRKIYREKALMRKEAKNKVKPLDESNIPKNDESPELKNEKEMGKVKIEVDKDENKDEKKDEKKRK